MFWPDFFQALYEYIWRTCMLSSYMARCNIRPPKSRRAMKKQIDKFWSEVTIISGNYIFYRTPQGWVGEDVSTGGIHRL